MTVVPQAPLRLRAMRLAGLHSKAPLAGGYRAGIAVFPHPEDHAECGWFVTDWGVVTVGPFRLKGQLVALGQSLTARYRVIAFDGAAADLDLAQLHEAYAASGAAKR